MTHREVLVHVDEAALIDTVAGMLVTRIVERQADTGLARVVLTGGRAGTAVLAAIARPPLRDAIAWDRIDVWWGDERFLPAGHADRNDTAADDVLLSTVKVDPLRVHRIAGPDRVATPEESADEYAIELARCARPEDHGPVPRFDVVLLSIGPDGHVASLFPEAAAIREGDHTVVAVHAAPKPPATRVTLTLSALNAGVEAWVLATGAEKASAVRLACDPAAGPYQVPASGVRARERTLFMIDEAAAALLPEDMGRTVA